MRSGYVNLLCNCMRVFEVHTQQVISLTLNNACIDSSFHGTHYTHSSSSDCWKNGHLGQKVDSANMSRRISSDVTSSHRIRLSMGPRSRQQQSCLQTTSSQKQCPSCAVQRHCSATCTLLCQTTLSLSACSLSLLLERLRSFTVSRIIYKPLHAVK